MLPAMGGAAGDGGGPPGLTYAAALIRLPAAPPRPARAEGGPDRAGVLAVLREVRFSGWLAGPADGWLVAVAASGAGTVAAGRRGVLGVAARLADRLGATVLAVRVVADRQLLLAAWEGPREVGRYLSDPAYGLDDPEVLAEPLGVEHAAALAAACGRPDAADELAELLAEELDPDSVIESERLAAVLALLGLPSWLVAVSSLPRDVPTGPRAADVTRLGAGAPGLSGRVRGRLAALARRRPPPPAVPDPPRGAPDPWYL